MARDANPDPTPDRASTGSGGRGYVHPASEAGASADLGAPPDSVSLQDSTGPERRRVSQDAAVTAAENDAFWRKSFAGRDYTDADRGYDYYRPAYRYGWESRDRHSGRTFDEIEGELRSDWDQDAAGMDWDQARAAVRDAYERQDKTEASTPGNPLA